MQEETTELTPYQQIDAAITACAKTIKDICPDSYYRGEAISSLREAHRFAERALRPTGAVSLPREGVSAVGNS